MAPPPVRVPKPLASSVDELLEGTRRLGTHQPPDARSPAPFERVEVDGRAGVVKFVHPDHDFMMRVSGDIGCRPRRVWAAGFGGVAADLIDDATLGIAPWGRNGWGAAVLMRDVSSQLVPVGDEPLPEAQHLTFLDHCAGLCARTWGWHDDLDLLPYGLRWASFGVAALAGEAALGFPEPVPKIAAEGWARFATRAPADVVATVDDLRRDVAPLTDALQQTPSCFLHGDWKLGNLGTGEDGRTILLDWAYPGAGPPCHELAWYLSLNRARLPIGHSKGATIDAFRAALERHGVDTAPWWEHQLDLCLLGATVQFGWEKALGDDADAAAELGWWCERAREGLARL